MTRINWIAMPRQCRGSKMDEKLVPSATYFSDLQLPGAQVSLLGYFMPFHDLIAEGPE